MYKIDLLDISASQLLFAMIKEIKDNSESESNMIDTVRVFEPIVAWLFNILHGKVITFPFHHWVSVDTTTWYDGICHVIFESNINAKLNKWKVSSITDSDDDDNDSVSLVSKKVKFVSIS